MWPWNTLGARDRLACDPYWHGGTGQLRDAARLYGRAALAGNAEAAAGLVRCWDLAHPGDRRAARWAAGNVPVDDPAHAAYLLRALRMAGADEEARHLAGRVAAGVRLDDPPGVAELVVTLRKAGTEDQVRRLAGRTAADTPSQVLGNASSLAAVLHGLWRARAREQVRLLADRAAGRIPLDDARFVAQILDILAEAGAHAQAAALLGRDLGRRVPPGNGQAAALLAALRRAGADHQAEMLIRRLPEAGLFGLFREQPGNERLYQFGREADGGPAPAWGWDDVWL